MLSRNMHKGLPIFFLESKSSILFRWRKGAHRNRFCGAIIALCLLSVSSWAYDVEDYEEPGGMSFSLQGNSQDSIYGISFEDATWLVGTPIMGQFFLNTLWHDKIDASFGGVGMIFRIMPRWPMAPYVGGGASYNQLLNGNSEEQGTVPEDEKVESTWAGHAETGLRLNVGLVGFFELYGRQTWSACEAVGDYWTLGLGYGQNW